MGRFVVGLILSCVSWAAQGASISSIGSVTALTHINQLTGITGTASFNEYSVGSSLPVNAYSGIQFYGSGQTLGSILPGVTTGGVVHFPQISSILSLFPAPIAGGGVAEGHTALFAGVVTFDQAVTQFGLTASHVGPQYLTAWDIAGSMLGQVTWAPNTNDLITSFVGIDTGGVPIGMLAYGNDDLWNGASYYREGATIISDNWVWGNVTAVPLPGTLALLSLGLAGLGFMRRKSG